MQLGRIALIVGGMVIGVAIGVGSRVTMPAQSQSEPASASSTHAAAPVKTIERIVQQVPSPDLDRRIAALEAAGAVAPAAVPNQRVLPEYERTHGLEVEAAAHQALVDRFRNDQSDPAWARTATSLLSEDLVRLAENGGFKTISVDCRTVMCAAVLEWKNYSEARQHAMDLAGHPYKLNCAREVHTPSPTDGSQPYRVEMVFDCEGLRADGT
jgi:hypothetical protein